MKSQPSKLIPINLVNLLAIGAFLYYLTMSLAFLIMKLVMAIGIMMEAEPIVLFVIEKIVYLSTIILMLRIYLKEIWVKIDESTIRTSSELKKLVIFIVIVEASQLLMGFFLMDFLLQYFKDAVQVYYSSLDSSLLSLVERILDLLTPILVLSLFLRWKKLQIESVES